MSEAEGEARAATAGAMLRAARERQGLHIAALAAAIKVSPRKLDALENDRWNELPDATFTRALAQTVCRTLKIDSRPVLEKLPAAATVALEPTDAGLNAPFRDRPGRDDPGLAVSAIKPMVWGAAVLMVAAVAVYFLPPGLFDAARTAPAPQPASAPVAVAPAPAALPVVPAASAPEAPASAAAAASVPQAGGETVFSAPAPAELAASAAAAGTPPAVIGALQLRTSEASWMEVRDGRGSTLLSRTVMPGEAVGLDGVRPFSLVIGNATATQLVYRGQTIDLAPRTRDNVARFELP